MENVVDIARVRPSHDVLKLIPAKTARAIGALPLAGLLMPAVFNGPLVGLELAFYINESGFTWEFFGIQALYVFIGEAAVLLTLGTALYFALTSRGIDKKLF